MKNIVLIGLSALLACSCGDVLEENPQAIAEETFYNTPSELEAGVAAIYSPLRSLFNSEYPIFLEASSDLFYTSLGSWTAASQYKALDATGISRASNCWSNLYRAVRNANVMINAIPNASETTDEEKNQYMGEAMFLRAFSYFHLVRGWGAVPLRTVENMLEYELPRSPEEDIYALIISDLEFAESNLPETVAVTGHATKWAAKLLLAEVYFTLGQYAQAADLSYEVIQSGQYSLVEIETWEDFNNLYGPMVETPEEIFYFRYNEQNNFGYIPKAYHGSGNAGEYIREAGYDLVVNSLEHKPYVEWDNNDLRKELWYYYDGTGLATGYLLLRKYNDPDGLYPRNSFPVYRYADCLLLYAEASCQVSSGPTAEGLEALNMVHRRAYGYPSTQPSPVDFNIADYNKDSFIKLCIQERGYETMGESKRWYDLKRLGWDETARYVRENRGVEMEEPCWLLPIPVAELNFNSAITDQNPGY